jgi:hypothetical protein
MYLDYNKNLSYTSTLIDFKLALNDSVVRKGINIIYHNF